MIWKYDVAYINIAQKERFKNLEYFSREEIRDVLNKWGEKGWELVSIIPATTWDAGNGEDLVMVMAFFKKPVPSN